MYITLGVYTLGIVRTGAVLCTRRLHMGTLLPPALLAMISLSPLLLSDSGLSWVGCTFYLHVYLCCVSAVVSLVIVCVVSVHVDVFRCLFPVLCYFTVCVYVCVCADIIRVFVPSWLSLLVCLSV